MQLICKLTNGNVLWDDDGQSILKDEYGNIVASSRYDNITEPIYDEIIGYYYFAQCDDKMVVLDGNGKELNDFLYDSIKHYVGGYAAVAREGKWTFIDGRGRELTKPIFDKVGSFKNDYAWGIIDKKTIFINEAGETVYEVPKVYYNVTVLQDEKFAVVEKNQAVGYGVIDLITGEEIIAPKYKKYLSYSKESGYFFMAEADCCVVIDCKGVIIKTLHSIESVGKFSQGYAVFSHKHNSKIKVFETQGSYGYIDSWGNVVIQPIFHFANEIDDEGYATVRFSNEQSVRKNIIEEIKNTSIHKRQWIRRI